MSSGDRSWCYTADTKYHCPSSLRYTYRRQRHGRLMLSRQSPRAKRRKANSRSVSSSSCTSTTYLRKRFMLFLNYSPTFESSSSKQQLTGRKYAYPNAQVTAKTHEQSLLVCFCCFCLEVMKRSAKGFLRGIVVLSGVKVQMCRINLLLGPSDKHKDVSVASKTTCHEDASHRKYWLTQVTRTRALRSPQFRWVSQDQSGHHIQSLRCT
jgi:hypothetical protein